MKELNRPQLSVSDGTPLPRRTGHGDFPHPALARVVYSRERSQRHQSQVVQVSVEANAWSSPPAALAAPTQVFAQAAPHEMVEVTERLARIAQTKVVGPASQMTVQSLNQFRQGCIALLGVNELSHRFPLPRLRFGRGLQVPVALRSPILVAVVPKGVAQKVQTLTGLPQVQHTSLFAVELQPQPPI